MTWDRKPLLTPLTCLEGFFYVYSREEPDLKVATMKHKSLKIEEFRELISKGEASDPLVFLESIMNGQDPRRGIGNVYKFAIDCQELHEGPPDQEDWTTLLELIRTYCKYQIVKLDQSQNAAKTLAEYLHPKRKHVETSDSNGESKNVNELTQKEIKTFLKIYEKEF